MAKRLTVTFEDDALYASLRSEAARTGLGPNDILAQALRDWLEAREDSGLAEDLDKARQEYRSVGGIEASEFFRSEPKPGQ